MENIKFTEAISCHSQQTLANILSKNKYYFESISEYDNTMFYLVVRFTEKSKSANFVNKLFGWVHKVPENRFVERKLSYLVLDADGYEKPEPCVYTRTDVENIVKDVPQNYVGEMTL